MQKIRREVANIIIVERRNRGIRSIKDRISVVDIVPLVKKEGFVVEPSEMPIDTTVNQIAQSRKRRNASFKALHLFHFSGGDGSANKSLFDASQFSVGYLFS